MLKYHCSPSITHTVTELSGWVGGWCKALVQWNCIIYNPTALVSISDKNGCYFIAWGKKLCFVSLICASCCGCFEKLSKYSTIKPMNYP